MYGSFTVVGLRLVTSRSATSTRGSLLVIERERPLPEMDPFRKHLGQCGSVRCMACYAASALELAVNVKIMQIHGAVSEVCGIRGVREPEQIPVMAAEAQCKLLVVVRDIEAGRKFLLEKLRVNGTVRVMARRATAGLDRPVDIGHRLGDDVLMTTEAELFLRLVKHIRVVARMRRMAGDTTFLRHDRWMLRFRLLHGILDLGVALIAYIGPFRR